MSVLFYVGLHQPGDAGNFDRACISINRLRTRKKPVECNDVLVDSGAFTELENHGAYRHGVEQYAAQLRRLHDNGVVNFAAATAQDFMCEDYICAIVMGRITKKDKVRFSKNPRAFISEEEHRSQIRKHQQWTVERYDALLACNLPFHILPVLQGFDPQDYARHIREYGKRLTFGMWVGVGSVCKRQGDPEKIVEVLAAIKAERPDLRLHGFGVKLTALMHPGVREYLYTADSMAWSYSARKQGRNGNSWREAFSFAERVKSAAARVFEPWQMPLPLLRTAA